MFLMTALAPGSILVIPESRTAIGNAGSNDFIYCSCQLAALRFRKHIGRTLGMNPG
jgi:hypothetical protein